MSPSSPYRNHCSPWTVHELTFVEQHYGKDMKVVEIAEYLGRTPNAVRSAAHCLGCSHRPCKPWTEAEKEIIRTHYIKGGQHVMTLLSGRTLATITWMAHKLNVESGRSWTQEEEHILAVHYPVEGTTVAKYLPDRTPEAVKIKACYLGIKYLGGGEGQQMWSEEEWARLAEHDHLILPALLELFPDRSRLSVKKARERLRKRKKQGAPVGVGLTISNKTIRARK